MWHHRLGTAISNFKSSTSMDSRASISYKEEQKYTFSVRTSILYVNDHNISTVSYDEEYKHIFM
jgi:hypothetical protein